MESKFEIELFKIENNKIPFKDWIESFDEHTQERILSRIDRIRFGNFGDYKNLGDGILELRFNFGSGYRIYFGKRNHKIIILLCGGNKKTQNKDIKKAQQYWEIYEQRQR
jgi:putative addiction module killer protein